MSCNIELVDPVTRETLHAKTKHQMSGGTYCVGGTTALELNVTYNYAWHFTRVFPELDAPRPLAPKWMIEKPQSNWWGIRTLYGLTGAESIPLLDNAIASLGDEVSDDYWKPTEGNAKRALWQLRALACTRPDGIWSGD